MPERKWKPDPMGERRNPFQVYLLFIALLSGVSSVAGQPTSTAVEEFLTSPYITIWGAFLVLGGVSTLAGMYWQGDARTGLLLKRLGLLALALPTLILGLVILRVNGFGSLTVGLTVLGFSVAALVQAYRVNAHIKELIRRSP